MKKRIKQKLRGDELYMSLHHEEIYEGHNNEPIPKVLTMNVSNSIVKYSANGLDSLSFSKEDVAMPKEDYDLVELSADIGYSTMVIHNIEDKGDSFVINLGILLNHKILKHE